MKERIKSLRKELGLTQTEFGIRLGIKQTTVAGWENAGRQPSEAAVRQICTTYNANYEWLKDGEGEMFLAPSDDSELVEQVMFGDNFFAKETLTAFASLTDEEWELLRRIVDKLKGRSL